MSGNMWYTKEDMLKDLAKASGGRVVDINDDFIAVGECPPPPPVGFEDDNDMELMFGETAGITSFNHNESMPLDLKGITKMIRMVQDCEDEEQKPMNEVATIKSDQKKVVVISKLNPNVKEFVPKSAIVSPRQNTVDINNSFEKQAVNGYTRSQTIDSTKVSKDTTKISEDAQCYTCSEHLQQKQDQTDIEQMAALLKKQITEAAKEDSFEKTKEKSYAISKLLKLYATSAPKTAVTNKPKLLSPDFFQKYKAADYDNYKNGERNKKYQREKSLEKPCSNENQYIDDESNKAALEDIKIIKESDDVDDANGITLLTPDMLKSSIDEGGDSLNVGRPPISEVEESISKVENWLEEKPVVVVKEKPKPVPYLGTVAFKRRKDPTTCKSPSEIGDKKISKTEEDVYKPSKQREEYLQKFSEQKKKMDVRQTPVTTSSNSLSDIIYHQLLEAEKRKRGNKTEKENDDASV